MSDHSAPNGFLGDLPSDIARWLETRLTQVRLRAGERLFHEGDPGDSLYLIANGRLQVTRSDPHGASQLLGELGRSEPIGEMALLTDEPRSATVHAIRDSDLARLDAADFMSLITEHPEAMRLIAERLIARLRSGAAAPTSPATTVAVIALGDRGAGDGVAAALRTSATTFGLDALVADTYDAEDEARHDLVLLTPRGTVDEVESAAANADRVLFVAAPGQPPSQLVDELRLRCPLTRSDLVVVHPEATGSPRHTRRLCEAVRPHRVHHLRLADGRGVDSLLRSIRQREVVLVLSGGGARGLAHVGVCKVLRELNVPIDAVVGTSAGSMVGALIALHTPLDEMRDELRSRIGGHRAALDFTAPAVSLASGRKITTNLREAFGDTCIEDCWTSFACVSTNLSRARPNVHDSGEMWWAVRSSIAVPGVFPPTTFGTDVLVDGGIINNLPVDIARARHPGAFVIAVDVGNDRELTAGDLPDDGIISGWSVVSQRINPFRPSADTRGILSILMRVTELGAVNDGDRGDLLIQPDVSDYGLFDFSRLDALIEAGEAATSAALASDGSGLPRHHIKGENVA